MVAGVSPALSNLIEERCDQTPPPASRRPTFFDHIVRSDESYSEKWEYVCQNGVRTDFVKEAEDWPYKGESVLIDRV